MNLHGLKSGLSLIFAVAWLAGCTSSVDSNAEIERPAATIVVGSSYFLPIDESPYQPSLMETATEDLKGPEEYILRATGNGGGVAIFCAFRKTRNLILREGGQHDRDILTPDLLIMNRPMTASEIETCKTNGLDPQIEQLAVYTGKEDKVDGAYVIYDASQTRDGGFQLLQYLRDERSALFDQPIYAAEFEALSE